MDTLLRAACLLWLMAACCSAQSWEALESLNAGTVVRVSQTDGQRKTGRWKSVNTDTVVMETRMGEVSINKSQVRRVETQRAGRRLRNAVIGAAIGVGVGIVIDQTLGQYLRNESVGGSARAMSYSVPIAVGAAIGALPSTWSTVYRVR